MKKDLIYKGIKFTKYVIDEEGRIWRRATMRLLTPFQDGRGYLRVDLMNDQNEPIRCKVHMCVAHTFLGPQKDGMIINHKDANKENNKVSNLEYITQRENVAHMMHHVKNQTYLTDDTVKEIRNRFNNGDAFYVIAEDMKLPSYVVRDIVKGITYKHVRI